jgi:SnoaL-like domain
MAHTHSGTTGGKHAGAKEALANAAADPSSRDEQARVQEVLDRFARALTAGDGEGVADLWETPAFVIGSGMARAVSARAEVVEFFGSGKEQYNALGITDTRAEIQRLDWVSDDLVVVDVRWPYLTANGEERGEERSTYTLLGDAQGQLKIRSVLMRGTS